MEDYSWTLDLGKIGFWKRLRFAWGILRGQEATLAFNADEIAEGKDELSAGGWKEIEKRSP